MEKIFENLKELLAFDFSELTASKSNYITILGANGLPKVRKSPKKCEKCEYNNICLKE